MSKIKIKAIALMIVVTAILFTLYSCNDENISETEVVEEELLPTISTGLIAEFGGITNVSVDYSAWSDIKKWFKKHFHYGFPPWSPCPGGTGFCYIFAYPVDPSTIYDPSEDYGLARVAIIVDQVRIQFESPATTQDGLFPIGDPFVLDTNLCHEFGFSDCTVLPGLYQADFSDTLFPYGVVYVDANTEDLD